MIPETFTTQTVRRRDQYEAWRQWFQPVFAVTSRRRDSFPARIALWKVTGLVISRVSAPPVNVQRTPTHIRRNPVDHWVVSCCPQGETVLTTSQGTVKARAGIPFLRSLGIAHQLSTLGQPAERFQLYLSRDAFRDIAPVLDAACGAVLDTPLGLLLGDFMLSLEQRLQELTLAEAQRLAAATRALIAASTAPSAERIAVSQDLIDRGQLERVRQTVRAYLHSPELGPDMLCRAVGTSRSGLYRLLEAEGGVRNYIQQQRLLEARAILGDPNHRRSVRAIAEDLCFMDPSNFGRAFRRLFGYSPRAAAMAALAGVILPGPRALGGRPRAMQDFGMALRRL